MVVAQARRGRNHSFSACVLSAFLCLFEGVKFAILARIWAITSFNPLMLPIIPTWRNGYEI